MYPLILMPLLESQEVFEYELFVRRTFYGCLVSPQTTKLPPPTQKLSLIIYGMHSTSKRCSCGTHLLIDPDDRIEEI